MGEIPDSYKVTANAVFSGFIQQFSAFDHYSTSIILYFYTGDKTLSDKRIQYLLEYHLTRMNTDDKRNLLFRILEDEYSDVYNKGREHLTKSKIKTITETRNILAHSHIIWREQKDDAFVFTFFRKSLANKNYKKEIKKLSLATQGETLSNALRELQSILEDLGILSK